MKSKINVMVIAFLALVLTSSFILAQDKMDHSKMKGSDKKSCCTSDKVTSKGSKCAMDKDKMHSAQPIDIKGIDENNDGKVYQCSMCPGRITDAAGKCPECDMELEEVTIEKAKNNLEKSDHGMMGMDHSKMMEMNHDKMGNSILREGVIDVEAIDRNKDGKVFQDMMDWNVISDEAGECPVCGMTLKEVTIDDAKNNLEKNSFEVT